MGIYIDRHFYLELFENKSVNCHNKLYLLLFDTIWPRAKNFELFLSSSENSLKIEYAKKIYEDFSFINDIFLPSFTVLNIIDDQYHNLVDKSEGYISQDHVIHCINTYILGVYLFFNSEKLNRKIIKLDGNENFYNLTKDFILKWQIFSLYHDVGYFFENDSMDQKNISTYEDIFIHILKSIISKHITRVITFKALTELHSSKFNDAFIENSIGVWYDSNGNKISKAKVKEMIRPFLEATCIDAISNDEEFSHLLPLIDSEEHLVAVYNEYGDCVSLIIRNNLDVLKIISKSNVLVEELFLNSSLYTANSKYIFKYYLLKIQQDNVWLKAINEPLVTKNLYSQLPADLIASISINSTGVQDLLFLINDWVSNSLTLDTFQEQKKYIDNYEKCLKKCFLNQTTKIIHDFISDLKVDNSNISQILNKLSSTVKNNKQIITNEILVQTSDLYNQHFATTHIFVEFFSELFDSISKTPCVLNSMESLNIFHKVNSKVSIIPFSYDKKNRIHHKLFSLISDKANELKIPIEQLLEYHSPYVYFDHGILSAGLLFQMVCFTDDVRKYCLKKSQLALAWTSWYNNEEHFLKFCSEVIFSVLLHNIYNKKSEPSYGINYTHNIDTNPFSYFCSFCDTLQKWGRPKNSNLSKTHLPITHYLEDEFDIDITNGLITIRCIKNNMKKTIDLIQKSELFLPGISKLINVKEF